MATIDEEELRSIRTLLEDAAAALASANSEVGRCQRSERTLEAIVDGILEHVPVPIVVVDDSLDVRAASAAARRAGYVKGSSLREPLVSRADHWASAGEGGDGSPPDGWELVPVEADFDGERFAVLWRRPDTS